MALAPAYAIAILMTAGPDDGCPSPHQLADALSAHLPGMVLAARARDGPDHPAPRRHDRRRGRHAARSLRSRGGTAPAPLAAGDRSRARGGLPGPGRDGSADRRALLARGRLRRSARNAERVAEATAAQGDSTAGAAARKPRHRRAASPLRGRAPTSAAAPPPPAEEKPRPPSPSYEHRSRKRPPNRCRRLAGGWAAAPRGS